MGAKTWMLVYAAESASKALSRAAPLDREASLRLATSLFPDEQLEPLPDGDLSHTNPDKDELVVGCFPGVSVVAAVDFAIDNPSHLPSRFLRATTDKTVYLHAMHSVVDWFAFAVWERGQLLRALSLSPDTGIIEDIGARLAFEIPYWDGQKSVDGLDEQLDEDERYPFPFHPLDLGETALLELFGYQLDLGPSLFRPEMVPLLRFKRLK